MNIVWVPPISTEDLSALSSLLRNDTPIVSMLDDFRDGSWEVFFDEHVGHGTEFFAHLDANFLSHLLRLFCASSLSEHSRQAAAVMCLAIVFEMQVNPTFATHEYAFSGKDAPDPRLAGFYHLNNLHPQQLADFALGREHGILPEMKDLPPTQHEGTHRQYLRTRGLTYASLLKIVELHRCTEGLSESNTLSKRFKRAEALLDWMYHEFLFCGTPLFIADQLWGQNRTKTVLKGIDTCDAGTVLSMCENASWDLVLAENWAESESNRKPGDPFHLIFTFDRALQNLAGQLLVKNPKQQSLCLDEVIYEKYSRSWPEDMAVLLADRYLRYQRTLDSQERVWNTDSRPQNDEYISSLEQSLCASLSCTM